MDFSASSWLNPSKLRLLFDAGRGTRAPTQIPLDAR